MPSTSCPLRALRIGGALEPESGPEVQAHLAADSLRVLRQVLGHSPSLASAAVKWEGATRRLKERLESPRQRPSPPLSGRDPGQTARLCTLKFLVCKRDGLERKGVETEKDNPRRRAAPGLAQAKFLMNVRCYC